LPIPTYVQNRFSIINWDTNSWANWGNPQLHFVLFILYRKMSVNGFHFSSQGLIGDSKLSDFDKHFEKGRNFLNNNEMKWIELKGLFLTWTHELKFRLDCIMTGKWKKSFSFETFFFKIILVAFQILNNRSFISNLEMVELS
jgi:hypothetical protein